VTFVQLVFSVHFNLLFFTASHLRHHHHISLREQLQVAGAANNPIMQGSTGQANVTTPGSDSRKSIFNRLGIRKPSILSLSSPQIPSSSTARTFSLDDLLRPLPRRKLSTLINAKMPSFHVVLFITFCTLFTVKIFPVKFLSSYTFYLSTIISTSYSLNRPYHHAPNLLIFLIKTSYLFFHL